MTAEAESTSAVVPRPQKARPERDEPQPKWQYEVPEAGDGGPDEGLRPAA
ncbi:hypothetical protein ABT010_02170 [Streptomyces sp. NPDC002668]